MSLSVTLHSSMGAFHVFKIVKMVPNRAKHLVWISKKVNLAAGFIICADFHNFSKNFMVFFPDVIFLDFLEL